eukprot:Rmarinus@m.26248
MSIFELDEDINELSSSFNDQMMVNPTPVKSVRAVSEADSPGMFHMTSPHPHLLSDALEGYSIASPFSTQTNFCETCNNLGRCNKPCCAGAADFSKECETGPRCQDCRFGCCEGCYVQCMSCGDATCRLCYMKFAHESCDLCGGIFCLACTEGDDAHAKNVPVCCDCNRALCGACSIPTAWCDRCGEYFCANCRAACVGCIELSKDTCPRAPQEDERPTGESGEGADSGSGSVCVEGEEGDSSSEDGSFYGTTPGGHEIRHSRAPSSSISSGEFARAAAGITDGEFPGEVICSRCRPCSHCRGCEEYLCDTCGQFERCPHCKSFHCSACVTYTMTKCGTCATLHCSSGVGCCDEDGRPITLKECTNCHARPGRS